MVENNIKKLRTSENMTLVNLRDEVNKKLKEKNVLVNDKLLQITDSQLSFYENGKRSPRNDEIWKALADIFDVDELYLLGYQSKKKYTEQDALEFEKLHIHIGEFTTTKLDLENLPNLDSILRAYTFSNKKGRELLQDIAEFISEHPEKYDAEIK